MNREYLIDIAMDTYAEASGQSVTRPWMEAAFDAVAARIWDEGWTAGGRYILAIGYDDPIPRPTANPYNASESA